MKKGYIYICITALAFSTMEIAGKMITGQINPFQLTFLRFLIGALILLPFALRDVKLKGIRLGKEDYMFFFMLSILGVVVSMSLFQLAVEYTKAATVAVIFSTNPAFTVPFAYLLLREQVNKKTLLSLLISVAGILFFFNPSAASFNLSGILLAIAAAVTFSLFGVIGKKRIDRYGGLVLNCFTFLFGSILMLVLLLLFRMPVVEGIGPGNIAQILYMGIFVTGIGYLSYFQAMKETSAITASTVFFIKPALAPLLSFFILREAVTLNALLGIIFILTGAYTMYRAKSAADNSLKTPKDCSHTE